MAARNVELGRNEHRFDMSDPKWHCCCNTHCETGAAVIGIFQWLVALGMFIVGFTRFHSPMGVGNVIGGLLMLLVGTLILIAINKQQPKLLLPVLIIYAIQIGVLTTYYVIIIITYIIPFSNASSARSPFNDVQNYNRSQLTIFSSILITESLIRIWFFQVLWQCRRYLQEQQMASTLSEVQFVLIARPQPTVVGVGGRDAAVMQHGQSRQQNSVVKTTDIPLSSSPPSYESLMKA